MDQNTAIEELQKLGAEVDSVTELSALKPIYFRLDQISKKFPDNFDVQVVVSELKQRLVSHGQKLKDSALAATGVIPLTTSGERAVPPQPTVGVPAPPPPPPPAVPPTGLPTMQSGNVPNYTPTAAVATPPSMQARVPSGSGGGPTSFQSSVGSIPPPQKPPSSGPNLKRALLIGAGIGFAAFAVILIVLVNMARKPAGGGEGSGGSGGTAAGISEVVFNTTPPGATILVTGNDRQEKCTSNCKINLPPGNYQVTASLDGYNPSASAVVVSAGNPTPPVDLPLQPVAQSVKIISDVPGKVLLDGKPVGDLQEGQYILDRVALGQHTVTVQGTGAEATFSFVSEAGKAPAVSGPATAKNLLALLVATAGKQAKLYASNTVKVKVDDQDRGEVGAGGTDLSGLSTGEHSLEAGEGKDMKKMVVSVVDAPMLTAYLKSDVNAGFLVVVAGQEDDVAIAIEGRPWPRKTQRGQLRVQLAPNKYRIRAIKDGFEPTIEQTTEIKKGEESKIVFAMKPLPRMAQLKVTGATPGATITLDRVTVGKVGSDGTFSTTVAQPGDKVIEFSLAGYSSRQTSRTFKAGETVSLTTEGVLSPAASTIRLILSPALPESKVTMRRDGDAGARNITDPNLQNLPPGTYTVTASAKGYTDRTEKFTLTGGEIRSIDVSLKKEAVVVKEPVLRAGTIADLEGTPTRDGDAFVFKGPTAMYKGAQTTGVFTFTVRPVKGRKIRWLVNYRDAREFALFELEKEKLVRKDGNKKLAESAKFPAQEAYQVRVDIRNGALVTQINVGGAWMTADNWQDPGRNFGEGRFGFRIDGKDEIAISDFRFTPSK